jgi:OmpA-OmpF porin, OOP family
MSRRASWLSLVVFAVALAAGGAARAQGGDGEGVDSQLVWASPGPSSFATLQSADILGHKQVSFGAVFDYYRRPLALDISSSDGTEATKWVVEYAATADFMWAFGIADWVQLGVILPVVLDQEGVGATPLMPLGADESTYKLAGAALKDLRFDAKVRFVGQKKPPEARGVGLAADLAVSFPTGDELNFAGEKGFVFAPSLVLDYRKTPISVGLNAGARLRTEEAALADLTVGHQMTAGIGVTGHLLDRRFLLGAEATLVAEMDGFDRLGFEYRGSVGYVPDQARAVTLWLSGGASAGTGDLLGTPKLRFLLGITYAPQREDEDEYVPEEPPPPAPVIEEAPAPATETPLVPEATAPDDEGPPAVPPADNPSSPDAPEEKPDVPADQAV